MSKKLIYNLLVIGIFINTEQLYSQQNITLNDIWYNYKFVPNSFEDVVFLSDNETFARLNEKSIIRYNALTGDSIDMICNSASFKQLTGKTIRDFKISKNDSSILISVDCKNTYRYSYLASYFVYSVKTKKIKPLITDNFDIDIPDFNPKNESIAFVKDNNLYISQNDKTIQITFDGKKEAIKNGRTDWVYEEEFEVIKAYEWSPDGKQLAWLRFDETNVPSYTLTSYDSIYPTIFTYKYPKAGYPNSKISIHIYNTINQKITDISAPNMFEYTPLIQWSLDSKNLAIQTLNRLQNQTQIFSYSLDSKKTTCIYDEKRSTYISFPMGFTWLRHNNHFALITEKDGFDQLCTFTLDGKFERNITNWKYDVRKIIAYDSLLDYVFFEANEPDETQKRIYRVRPDGSFLGYITPESGTNDNAVFSNDYFHCIYTNTNAKQEITTYSFDELKGQKNILQSNIISNESWQKQYTFSPKTFFKIPVDSVKLNAWIIKPPQFDVNKKYPVLLTIYGGPGHQEVTDEFSYLYYWYQYLAQNGYIVLCIDPRGTDGRGSAFKTIAYKQLGIPQTNDIIEAVKNIRNQPFVDSLRIGIEGWSFGGYQSLMCMTHSKLFKCGVAIAPVTDWHFYDNIYTERYMQTPDLNEDGYNKTSVIKSAKNLHGKLLLIHGDNDDNVHIQNSYDLCNALNNANIKYNFLLYPNKHHSLSGRTTRLNLFENITTFLFDNL